MDLSELLERVTRTLEELSIPYLVTGSVATIAYGEPRFTNDVDVVVRLPLNAIEHVLAAFPEEEFYLSREAMRDAVLRSTQFNILHPRSGLKIDVIVADDSEFNSSRFDRSRRLAISPTRSATFASAEDVILKKLEYYREGGSDKHLRDIAGVIAVVGKDLDLDYVERWAERLGLGDLWNDILRAQDHR